MHDLYKQENLPYLNVKLCPNCNELVSLDTDICPNCTFNFKSKKVEAIKKEVVSQEVVSQEVVVDNNIDDTDDEYEDSHFINIVKNNKVIYCDKCGAKIIGEQKYCGGCGSKVSKKFCPKCENIVDVDLAFCTYCGEKLRDNSGIIEKSDEDVNSQVIVANNDASNETVVTEDLTMAYLDDIANKTQFKDTTVELANFKIKMGRKRFFVALQIIFTSILLFVAIMVPLISKNSFIDELIPCITGSSSETFFKGIDVFKLTVNSIKNNSIDFSACEALLVGDDNKVLFVNILSKLLKNVDNYVPIVTYIILSSYGSILIGILIVYVASIFGLIRKTPLKGKTLGILTIILAINAILIYSSTFFDGFKNYDTWLIYGFGLLFILWFIIKLVFGKEAKLYKKYKKLKKENSN